MARLTVTPWRHHSDLLAVRAALYSPSPSIRLHAVHRVMAWKLRGNLPHAVESTALLIDAILHHSNASPDTSTFSIRAVYAAAFTRFVTGFCDIGRNKERSLEPSSMMTIAKQIEMPVHFVAVRHKATHEELPSVTRLAKVCNEALEWLWTFYWSRLKEIEEGHGEVDISQARAEAKLILKTFRNERLESLRGKKKTGQGAVVARAVKICDELMQQNEEKMEILVRVLIEEKLLCPSKRALGSSLEGAFLIWDKLLEGLISDQKQFAAMLMKCLLQALAGQGAETPEQHAHREGLSLWLLHILTSDDWAERTPDKEIEEMRKETMQWCCIHPSHWAQFIGKGLLQSAAHAFQEDWQDIFEASQLGGQSSDADVLMHGEQDFTLDISEEALVERLAQYQSSVQSTAVKGWVRGPVSRQTPIGTAAK